MPIDDLIPGMWYVVDKFGDPNNVIVAGPFATKQAAERERRQLNIADDCLVIKWRRKAAK